MIGNQFRLTAVFAVAFTLSGCSIVPGWADPTSWFGDEDSAAVDANGVTPDLAALPGKPDAAGDNAQVAQALAADRSHAQYSAQELRAGTVTAAAPPPNLPAVKDDIEAPLTATATAATVMKPQQDVAKPAVAEDRSVTAAPTGHAMPGTLPSVGAVKAAPPAAPQDEKKAVQSGSLPDTTAMATPPTPPQPEPAAPPEEHVASVRQAPQAADYVTAEPEASAPPPVQVARASNTMVNVPQNPSDAALGFQPSSAPPLDPSVAEFVPAPIVQRYQQTAMGAGGVTMVASNADYIGGNSAHGQGGPEAMTGSVIANMDVIQNPGPMATADPYGRNPDAVVYFPGDRTSLNADARAQITRVVAQFMQGGNQGYVRVVGHSSSRTANMPVKQHLALIFKKSQARANAVAQALIRAGVPANNILVEAVGDSQPIYYESMPKGEEGNRRAEIFLQG